MNDSSELFARGYQIINDRYDWEQRQRRFYLMRHEGLRRKHRPWPQCADLHLRLIDEKVTQKKAFDIAQVFGTPSLATFVCMKQQLAEMTASAQEFFAFQMKHRTNFVRTYLTTADTKWLRGRGIIKTYVEPYQNYKIIHENIDPLYLLMPDDVNGFDDAYEWVHVKQIPVATFKNERRWCPNYWEGGKMDGKTLKQLCGGKDAVERMKSQRDINFEQIGLDRDIREGYWGSDSQNTIIIWEHYLRTMGGLTCHTYCPVALDIEVRKPYGVPYKVNGEVSNPFHSFTSEVKDEGWYAPRGVAEKIADLEIYGTKVWNAKADSITLLNTPQYESAIGVQNPGNYKAGPGEVMPPGIKPMVFGQPAISFSEELAFTR